MVLARAEFCTRRSSSVFINKNYYYYIKPSSNFEPVAGLESVDSVNSLRVF